MAKLQIKYQQLESALQSLRVSVDKYQEFFGSNEQYGPLSREEAERALRDSMVQRFEYTIDMFWKYLRRYMEQEHTLEAPTARKIVREAFAVGLLSEMESSTVLDMIDSRNITSHIYVEEIAERLANQIPTYCAVLETCVVKVTPNQI